MPQAGTCSVTAPVSHLDPLVYPSPTRPHHLQSEITMAATTSNPKGRNLLAVIGDEVGHSAGLGSFAAVHVLP